MKTIRLVLVFFALRDLNASPTTGMRPKKGTRCSPPVCESWIRPPSTTVPPSSISTCVLMVRLLVTRSTAPELVAAMLELSCSILSITESPSLICGVILRMVPTSCRWIVWKGFRLLPVLPPVLVYCPVTNGTSCATLISASWLSIVTIEGVAIMLVVESPRSARSTAAKSTPPLPRRPTPTVVPRGTLVSVVGSVAARARSTMLTPPTGSMKPPTALSALLPSTSQLTPSSADLSAETSTMIASTMTCARRISSLSITAIKEFMVLAGAVITSALVSGSAQMMVLRSALADVVDPAAGAPAATPCTCSLSFAAIFSASA